MGLVSARRRRCPLLRRRLRVSSRERSVWMVRVGTKKRSRVKAQASVVVVLPLDIGEPTGFDCRCRMLINSSGNTQYECSSYLGW